VPLPELPQQHCPADGWRGATLVGRATGDAGGRGGLQPEAEGEALGGVLQLG